MPNHLADLNDIRMGCLHCMPNKYHCGPGVGFHWPTYNQIHQPHILRTHISFQDKGHSSKKNAVSTISSNRSTCFQVKFWEFPSCCCSVL